jgi:uncharacterized protein (DUF1330 family)
MAAYLIADIEVTDPKRFEAYRPLAAAAILKFGGKYLVRGGAQTPLEGGWAPPRLVIVEFASLEVAKQFYDSPEYRQAREVRKGAARFKLLAVEGA